MPQVITAKMILDLLRARHSNDVFVDECKDGPTQFAHHSRMDVWTMKKSWSHPLVTAYEIKVSRGDFLSDGKWMGYLPYCNEFYFAVAHGIVSIGEIPEEVGLLVGSKNTRRLYCKKKAPYRDVVIPESVFRYVLFSRARITREHIVEKGAYWRDFLADKRDLRDVGHKVSHKLRKVIAERIDEVEQINRQLQKENENLQDVKRLCKRLGVNPKTYSPEYRAERQIKALRKTMPQGLIANAESLQKRITSFLEKIGENHVEVD